MKFLVPLFVSLGLFVSSVSGFSTYVSTSGSTLNINYNNGTPYSNSVINLAPGAYLAGVDLFDTNLTDADLSNANLTGAIFAITTLTDANLSNANLTGAILINTNFSGANLSGANLTHTFMGNYLFGTAAWTGANLYGASLPDGYDQDWFEEQGAIFLETVPEPSTYALLLGGIVLGYAFWRRRK